MRYLCIYFIFLIFKYFIVILLQLPQFFPLCPPPLGPPLPCSHSQSPPCCSCPWVIHTCSSISPCILKHSNSFSSYGLSYEVAEKELIPCMFGVHNAWDTPGDMFSLWMSSVPHSAPARVHHSAGVIESHFSSLGIDDIRGWEKRETERTRQLWASKWRSSTVWAECSLFFRRAASTWGAADGWENFKSELVSGSSNYKSGHRTENRTGWSGRKTQK